MVTALFVLRAQPFHKGHQHAIKHVLRKYDRVIIALGSTNKHDANNPFSYRDRRKMIVHSLGKQMNRCRIVGVPDVADDAAWRDAVLRKAKADVVVTANPWTKACFRGMPVEKPPLLNQEVYRATRIRELIRKGGKWHALVPSPVIPIAEKMLRKNAP